MFKTTLTSALLVSASATQAQDAVKTGAAIIKRAKNEFHQMQTSQKNHALSAVKDFKLANKGVSLQARGVSKSSKSSARALRGKGGKGKGKSKSDDDKDEPEEESGDEVMSRQYLQMSSGMCAGTDLGFGSVYTEDEWFFHGQLTSGSCLNSIDSDGYPFSFKASVMAEPFTVVEYTYTMHDCKEEYVTDTQDVTADYNFGGTLTASGVCTDFGGFGIRLQVSGESLTFPDGFVGVGDNTHVNDCVSTGDLSMFDFVEMEAAFMNIPGVGTFPMCHTEDSDDDGDDDAGDDAGSGGSYQYDVSGCGGTPSTLATYYFSDGECSVPTTSEVGEAKSCFFDVEDFIDNVSDGDGADFFYTADLCTNVA
mmetsp:Transcript_18282/g.30488  ORF Transcript_18282/g.30488 Transcript_18282/m.30488 type:complete len:366 (+) Transcript_18282:37-1134(+)|eukprot:CAMPEP_0114430502 /NCGR_PEP_ID=MMETSP0103-20121206/10075_1 /TAXON_ID=37642 ORGANISM="Paraphysomonas imperforata, Strain PA2" /NCGR_SAMPLE_ID=MMETSP0103 /ASSEMBLY_ACC=CAM_ASM_000201 /LENGTH=365 /DNA_ID=CAMNT_0001599953 /DNA_START=36 /DNA_END=1133 /DNA_ORIENTATION=-